MLHHFFSQYQCSWYGIWVKTPTALDALQVSANQMQGHNIWQKECAGKGTHILPLQEEFQENGKIGDAVHVSFQIQD